MDLSWGLCKVNKRLKHLVFVFVLGVTSEGCVKCLYIEKDGILAIWTVSMIFLITSVLNYPRSRTNGKFFFLDVFLRTHWKRSSFTNNKNPYCIIYISSRDKEINLRFGNILQVSSQWLCDFHSFITKEIMKFHRYLFHRSRLYQII